ncbi:hypothetical protein [Salmonella enterica]|uniref:hypothetical protein n=1 Tax=Salmonella enterica TaxID=28901 RepID=UPI000B8B31AC|nr:hypothetical protein [Salmonella enterica]OXM32269.1 hypothetical protein NW10_10460 [Salmonella enterica subsp. enterica serovar Weslaco]
MNDKTLIKLGRYVVNIVPVFYICAMIGLCYGVQNIIATITKENTTLTKRLTAADLKRSEAERQLAANKSTPASPGIVIISPNGSHVQPMERNSAYSSLQREVSF